MFPLHFNLWTSSAPYWHNNQDVGLQPLYRIDRHILHSYYAFVCVKLYCKFGRSKEQQPPRHTTPNIHKRYEQQCSALHQPTSRGLTRRSTPLCTAALRPVAVTPVPFPRSPSFPPPSSGLSSRTPDSSHSRRQGQLSLLFS